MADKDLFERAPVPKVKLGFFGKVSKALHDSTKDLPGGPVTKAATLAGIEGAAAGAGYAIWGLPGAAISGGYGLYQGYKALKGAYDSIKEDTCEEELLKSMLLLSELRALYEEIKEDLTDEDFNLFLEEGFTADEIVDLFSTDEEFWAPFYEAIDQLDELSKKTLGNYLVSKELRHRYDDEEHHRKQAERESKIKKLDDARYATDDPETRNAMWKSSNKIEDEKIAAKNKFERKGKNSWHGTINAVNRLQGKFAGKKVVDEPEVRSPKRGYLTKHEKSHMEYKPYTAESVEEAVQECDGLDDRSRKIYMNPKMANVPLEGTFSGSIGDGGKGGAKGSGNAKAKKSMKEDVEDIQEISKKVLGSYINKAASSAGYLHGKKVEAETDYKHAKDAMGQTSHNASWANNKETRSVLNKAEKDLYDANYKFTRRMDHKIGNRMDGIKKATTRLTKEDVDIRTELEDIIRSSLNGDASDIKDRFETILTSKIDSLIDLKREEVASNLFNTADESGAVEAPLEQQTENDSVDEGARMYALKKTAKGLVAPLASAATVGTTVAGPVGGLAAMGAFGAMAAKDIKKNYKSHLEDAHKYGLHKSNSVGRRIFGMKEEAEQIDEKSIMKRIQRAIQVNTDHTAANVLSQAKKASGGHEMSFSKRKFLATNRNDHLKMGYKGSKLLYKDRQGKIYDSDEIDAHDDRHMPKTWGKKVHESEQIDEISKKTMGSYVQKAANSLKHHSQEFGKASHDSDGEEPHVVRSERRLAGLNLVAKKTGKKKIADYAQQTRDNAFASGTYQRDADEGDDYAKDDKVMFNQMSSYAKKKLVAIGKRMAKEDVEKEDNVD
jgi:hypothetical protein